MSDSSLSDGAPSTPVLKHALQNAVSEVYRSGDLDNLTIKRIRKSVEADLGLEDDFFKNDPWWKEESKNIIQFEVVRVGESVFSNSAHLADKHAQDSHADPSANGIQPPSTPSPRPPPKSKKAQPNLPEPQKPNRDFRGTKRPSSDKAGPNKRRRKETPDTEDFASEEEDVPRKKPTTKPKKPAPNEKTGPKQRQQEENSDLYLSGSEEEEISSRQPVSKLKKVTGPSPESENNEELGQISEDISGSVGASERKAKASESEMSEVLDEAPKIKSRKRKSDPGKVRPKKTEISRRKKPTEQSTDPDIEEIKRLQGWLIKCGIRKMWHRELAPYDNTKAKIRHLKELLADAGMTGRYSIEKANHIKEERELQADLEAVQAGAKQWGKSETQEEDDALGRPKRRLAKGLQELSFLNDDDAEETD